MPTAAVPDFFKNIDYSELPPGHKYGMFFPVWDNNWKKLDGNKTDALKKVFAFKNFEDLSNALVDRQNLSADSLSHSVFRLPAESVSPFMTGTGMEHPLENGFAFLAPYGLPYLAGSGVKGVLRRTAEYLRDFEFGEDNFGWSQTSIDILFGPEPKNGDSETARRGALVFWDVFIQPKEFKLGMDILTPHYTKYYEGTETPHESGQPVPVPFLVVPSEAKFNFYIQCNAEFIAEERLQQNWRSMVKILLEHSFDWLGFGAKTASGYGQLKADIRALQELAEQEVAAKKANMSVVDRLKDDINKIWGEEKTLNRKQAGGPLDNAVGVAIKEAIDLSEAERQEIYRFAKEAMTWLGKDKKKMKEKLAPLNITQV